MKFCTRIIPFAALLIFSSSADAQLDMNNMLKGLGSSIQQMQKQIEEQKNQKPVSPAPAPGDKIKSPSMQNDAAKKAAEKRRAQEAARKAEEKRRAQQAARKAEEKRRSQEAPRKAGQIRRDTGAKTIEVALERTKDTKSYDKTKQCAVYFSYKNNSYGTIYNLKISLDAYDDRGEKVGEILSASADPFGVIFGGADSIPVGYALNSKSKTTFKTSCKYLKKVVAVGVKNKYCGLRNLPEKVNCVNLLKVKSNLPGVNFVKK